MFHYKCPRCGNISTEGFSLVGGPECVRCGTEMVAASDGPPQEPDDGDGKRRTHPPRDLRAV